MTKIMHYTNWYRRIKKRGSAPYRLPPIARGGGSCFTTDGEVVIKGVLMRVLGIDPGYNIIGYGVVDSVGNKVVDFGVITTPKNMSISNRLTTIYQATIELMETFKPDEVAFEELFFNTNNTTAIPVAEARGVLIVASKQHTNRLFEYTPLQIKQALTGNGRAEKKQVQFMVKNILGLKETPKPDDAADALAVALTHIQTNSVMSDNSI